jgi:hypothetical protein
VIPMSKKQIEELDKYDPALKIVQGFDKSAQSAEFQNVLQEIAALCKTAPKPYRANNYPLHFEASPVFQCNFDPKKLQTHFGQPKGKSPELLEKLAEQIRKKGFYLVTNTDISSKTTRLLLPTNDPFAVVYAHDVSSNGLMDLDEIVAGLRKIYKLAAFYITDCGHDTISGSFLKTVKGTKEDRINEILNEICPCEDFMDEFGDEFEEDEIEEDEESGMEGFFLWWD